METARGTNLASLTGWYFKNIEENPAHFSQVRE
jgi:hypothetical protein